VNYTFVPMSDEQAQAVAAWKYDGIYAFYDWTADADDLAELLDPVQRAKGQYHAVLDQNGILIGFYEFSVDASTVEFGLGLRPDLTGHGLGSGFLSACLDYAKENEHPATFRLKVAVFNERAIRVYELAGFRRVREFRQKTNNSEWDFVEMSRPA
jgi:[ribosomal protein S18]-alanine N-acetyltransferase